jgi:hypothetical protein
MPLQLRRRGAVLHGRGDAAPTLNERMREDIPMSDTAPSSKRNGEEKGRAPQQPAAPGDEPGTNAVEHEPDPKAEPIPDGEHKYIRRSPYTAGNN